MTSSYEQLVKALRCKRDDCEGCDLAFFDNDEGWMCQYAAKDDDAADAIEELKDMPWVESVQVDKLRQRIDELEETACHCNVRENAELIAKILDDDVDGKVYQMPKRGKWVEDTTTYAGPGLSNYKCSLCGKICGTWRRGLEPSKLPNWCGNCGADMRAKMEVQE